ncbi:cysteine hydrolase [Sporolactobacillus shoreae]|uniref:Cysteine hydrolase n=1 Tax=Sporolactobacillus shoreae TaxID=1465501 RepID=A0A4Z0GP91_9BACL|nr:cysteine hydrolase family protein [Sporolactobacillus shoreae]TGA99000.1 cysteine hydrolase [Sporolactobacillus shoreae]
MQKTALLIIDVQNGMFYDENPVYNGTNLISNLKMLIQKARTAHVPIFFIQHNAPVGKPLEYGTEGWEIYPELTPTDSDIFIQKATPDSFLNTDLDEELKKRNINHLILTGIQTEVCVDTTCRRAFSMGYGVTLVKDTHSTWDTKDLTAQQIINHHNQVLRWFADTKNSSEIEF